MALWFNRIKYAIPFGKFSSSNYSEFPTNEVLVGREGSSRADLIDFLIDTGPQGSFLVTGRRGVGKSNFVDYCLREYERSVFKRFLRSNLGRSFSELFMLLLIPIVGIYLVLCYSQLAPIIIQNIQQNPLLVILLCPIIISSLWLCIYARNIFSTILKYLGIKFEISIPAGSISIILVILSFLYLYFTPIHSSPSSILSKLLILICNAYVIFQVPHLSNSNNIYSKLFNILGMLITIIWGIGCILLLEQFLNPWNFFSIFPDKFGKSVAENILLSSELILIGLTVRYADLITKMALIDKGKGKDNELTKKGIIKGKLWIASLIIILILLFSFFLYIKCPALNSNFILYHTWISLIFGVVFFITLHFISPNVFNTSSHEPSDLLKDSYVLSKISFLNNTSLIVNKLSQFRPEVILILKSLCFLVIVFQLMMPLVSEISTTINPPSHEASYIINNSAVNTIIYDQYIWFIMVSILLFCIYCIEYEWIVRPGIIAREDNALSPGKQPSWNDFVVKGGVELNPDDRAWNRRYYFELERLSLPYLTYITWMPTLITTINLGFDTLDQKRVIQAMLVGLRQQYYAVFLSWSSARANLKRFVNLNGILVIILVISNIFFNIPNDALINSNSLNKSKIFIIKEKSVTIKLFKENESNQTEITKYYPKFNVDPENNYCQYEITVGGTSKYPAAPKLLCKLSNDIANLAIPFLYFEIIPVHISNDQPNLILFSIFNLNREIAQTLTKNGIFKSNCTLSVRMYHLLLFLLIVSIFKWVNIKSPIFTHKRNIQQIDDLLDSLTGRVSRTRSRELSKPAQWVQSIFIDSESHTFEQENSDPRTVELAFLSVLNDIRRTSNVFPLAFSKRTYAQAIEVTFVFDELDKLSVHSDDQSKDYGSVSNESASHPKETNEYQAEQIRNDKMQHLLSDMKRILSSAPARFIFVGGRQLYDQWLADGTKKQPLLTSIFSGQINLKSLLVHHDNHWAEETKEALKLSDTTTFHSRIEEYLYLQHYYSGKRYEDWIGKQWVPFFGLHDVPQIEPDFSQWTYNITENDFHKKIQFISCENSGEKVEFNQHLSKFYLESFIYFLTYRSAGNPKKLKELLANFVQPASRVVRKRESRELNFPEQDVLSLNSLQVLRIELISSIYEHLRSGFERQLITRDDKIVEALFYLTDFLFKFHSRAFSWDSLERIDELDHVHRPPDLHLVLEKLVDHSSEKFLHKVFNGMYSFRFRSDITKEIEYLSRYSAEEMAAFNFTLDESQALKQSYKRALGTTDNINPDLVSGLGALYEYDQDFEAARHNYRHAIRILDQRLEYVVGSKVDLTGTDKYETSMLKAIYSGELNGQKNAAIDLSWGGPRLRIMLKIGLTYERTKNYERAVLQYRQCLILSNILIDAYLKKLPNQVNWDSMELPPLDDNICEHNQVLKHLNIIFQPIFASAWVSEKWFGGIDSGTSIIEKELLSLRKRLPFVKKVNITKNEKKTKQIVGIGNAYFSIIMSQLHNKAGDLYFFKGIQNIEYGVAGSTTYRGFNNTGYLLMAHYHYSVGLHEMRRYIFYRKCRANNKPSFSQDGAHSAQPIAEGCWPNYMTLGVSEGLSDLSESTLALVSGWQLMKAVCIDREPPITNSHFQKFTSDFKQKIAICIVKWFEMSDSDPEQLRCHIRTQINSESRKLFFKDWFGVWTNNKRGAQLVESEGKKKTRIIDFPKPNSFQDRFLMSLYLSIASAELRENAGYLENSAREYLQICDTISQYFWWFCSISQLENIELSSKINDKHFLFHCLSISVWILEYIDKLYRLTGKTQDKGKYKIGKTIPPFALTLACSLSIVTRIIFSDYVSYYFKDRLSIKLLWDRLTELIVEWSGANFNREGLQIIAVKNKNEKRKKIKKFISRKKENTILIVYLKSAPSAYTIAGFNGEGVYKNSLHDDRGSMLSKKLKKWTINNKSNIAELAASKLGFSCFEDRNHCTINEFQSILKNSISIHKYPVLNQLNILKLLIDTDIFTNGKLSKDCTGWVEELHELNNRYNAPLHFTPNMTGITYASFLIKCKEDKKSIKSLSFDLESEVIRLFRVSREMYTMGRSYYTSIDNLYYLYDDFNDRLFHRNHAMQMASAELVRQYEKIIIKDI